MPSSPPELPLPNPPDQTVSFLLFFFHFIVSFYIFYSSKVIPTLEKVDSIEPIPASTATSKTFYNAWVPPGTFSLF